MATTGPAPKLRWYQFSLRTLLVFVTLCAFACSWLAVKMKQAKRQREAVATIRKLGVGVSWSKQSGPPWLVTVLGNDFFQHVDCVSFSRPEITDVALGQLKEIGKFETLSLVDSGISDDGLEQLAGLEQLEELDLRGQNVTDAGLGHLKGLTKLKSLWLGSTKITGAGLKHLNGLTQLEHLSLNLTQVDDSGLEYLRGLSHLKSLGLACCTHVTDAGVKELQQALPNCGEISRF